MKIKASANAFFRALQPGTFRALLVFASLIGLLAAPPTVNGQSSSERMPANLTIFIVRHAEKPAQGDALAPEGVARAHAYAKYFQKQAKYDGQAIRWDFLFASTESRKSNRPFLTLQPLAEAMNLDIKGEFKNTRFQDLVDYLRKNKGHKFDNANVLICWHHGEIPKLASALGADVNTLPESAHWPKKWDQHAYGWLLKIYYTTDGSLDKQHTEASNEQLMPDDTVPLPER